MTSWYQNKLRVGVAVGLMCVGLTAPARAAGPTPYHVSSAGSDTAAGTAAAPFRTINRALAAAKAGDTVLVGSGSYPGIRDITDHRGWVTVRGDGRTPPQVSGAELWGTRYLRLQHLAFTNTVRITSHPVLKKAQPAEHVELSDSDVTTGNQGATKGPVCVQIRAASQDVQLTNNHIHDCSSGITSPAQDDSSRNILIRGNTIERFPGDAMQIGSWSDSVIDGNVIRGANDAEHVYHNDILQLLGNIHGLRVTNNELADSTDQVMLIQDAIHGPNDDILVENNLIHNSGGWGIQSQGALGARFIGNTIWNTRPGGLLLRASPYSHNVPHDTVVVNNIIDCLGLYEGATPGYQDYNLLARTQRVPFGPHDALVADPGFVDAARGDFHPRADSPARGGGSAAYGTVTDKEGGLRLSPPSVGALEYHAPSSP